MVENTQRDTASERKRQKIGRRDKKKNKIPKVGENGGTERDR